jgi:hypothetical protein
MVRVRFRRLGLSEGKPVGAPPNKALQQTRRSSWRWLVVVPSGNTIQAWPVVGGGRRPAERRHVSRTGDHVSKDVRPERRAPPSVRMLVRELLPRLLEGEHPALVALRDQSRGVTVRSVDLSGVGFFAHLLVPSDAPATDPARIVGGGAEITLAGMEHGAGCVLFVEDGRLSMLEGYTNAGEEWAEDAVVTSIGRVTPLQPANPPLQRT